MNADFTRIWSAVVRVHPRLIQTGEIETLLHLSEVY